MKPTKKVGDATVAETCRAAAQFCVERIAALGLKGKRADDAAMHYLTGYYAGVASIDAERAHSLGAWIAYVVAARGMLEVRMVANRSDAQ